MPPLLGIVGTIASIGGTLASASAAKQQADYQAQIQKQNAAMKLAEATRQAADTHTKTNVLKSNQLAAAAASGAGVETPTVADIVGKTAGTGEMHAGEDIANGQFAANNDLAQAQLARMRGNSAMTSGMFDAVGAGVKGISGVAGSNWWDA